VERTEAGKVRSPGLSALGRGTMRPRLRPESAARNWFSLARLLSRARVLLGDVGSVALGVAFRRLYMDTKWRSPSHLAGRFRPSSALWDMRSIARRWPFAWKVRMVPGLSAKEGGGGEARPCR